VGAEVAEVARNGKPVGAEVAEAARNGKPVGAEVAGGQVRIVGPLAAKEMVEALAAEYGKAGMPITLDYQRIDIPSVAAGALLAGRELMLSVGKLTEKDVSYSAARWKALAAAEHVIGARAVAIVVHERSPIDSLSMDQLRTIFSGSAREWSSFGGTRAAIRCYGLAFGDPLTAVFHGRVLSAARCGMIVRKGSSAEALSALAGDPHGIAFADAGAAAVSGETVKVIAIGSAGAGQLEAPRNGKPASGAAAAPNAQTIKDGTYPLAETLVLYVSPKGSEAAQDFSRFILAGGGDATIRKHGYMPTLRAVKADALAAFGKLYGPDIKRVKATPDAADDLALAGQMIQSARTARLDAELLAAMCESAYDLAAGASGGQTTAFEALSVLAERVPDKRFDCAVKRAALCEQAYKAGGSPADGERLVEALMTAADLGTSARSFAEAADAWARALAVAEVVNAPGLAVLKERRPAFEARVKSAAEAASLAGRLREKPQDVAARGRMLTFQLLELDQPAEAARYLDAATDEGLKTNVPLACQPAEKLSEESALKLAEWYVGLVDKAGVGGKELMSARARVCYGRFYEFHHGRDDALAMRAALGVQKVGGKVPDPPAPPEATAGNSKKGRKPPAPVITAGLKPGEEMTDLKLAEFVAAHPDLTQLGKREIGSARQITDLRPLERLTKLKTLELQQAGNLKDLSPLGRLPNLESLTLTGLEVDSISSLSGLGKVNNLNISGARNISDIAPIGQMSGLRALNLSGCDKLSDLGPLSRLTTLTSLNLSGCQAVVDLGPLEKLAGSLTGLNLSGTKVDYIMLLAKMTRLKTLDLRHCGKISAEDVENLAKRMPDCKVQSDVPAKQPS
jgi:ABC-type phosphate transport system substrate-binding protein